MSAQNHSGYIDPNWPNPNGKNDAQVIIYGYTPSFSLALFAALLFTLSFLLHTFQTVRHKTYYFIPVSISLFLEVLGYIFRCLSAHVDPYNIIYFVLQYFFIIVAPVFLTAGIYVLLSILITRTTERYSLLPPKIVLWIFISSDVVATIMQVIGAAKIGASESKQNDPSVGRDVLLAGLVFQTLSFFVFLILLTVFLRRARRVIQKTKEWRWFLLAFVIATLLVYLRICFRLAETAQGVKAYLFTHEGFFAGLEFVPIAVAVLLLNGWHPGRCLMDEVTAGNI